jgi:hypothetical protein
MKNRPASDRNSLDNIPRDLSAAAITHARGGGAGVSGQILHVLGWNVLIEEIGYDPAAAPDRTSPWSRLRKPKYKKAALLSARRRLSNQLCELPIGGTSQSVLLYPKCVPRSPSAGLSASRPRLIGAALVLCLSVFAQTGQIQLSVTDSPACRAERSRGDVGANGTAC